MNSLARTAAAPGANLLLGLALSCGGPAVVTAAAVRTRAGLLPEGALATAALCADWRRALPGDAALRSHHTQPAQNPAAACFTPVHLLASGLRADPTPEGCAFPSAATAPSLTALAIALEAHAAAGTADPWLLPSALPPAVLRSALEQNAQSFRWLAAQDARGRRWPYAAVVVPGYGAPEQSRSPVRSWLPGARCPAVEPAQLRALGPMVQRSYRALEALRGGVAPVVLVTGGAVHSQLNESLAMAWLLHCVLGVGLERIVLEPCAEHTHTNLRNAGRWLVAMGARAAWLVTDDFIQADYFQGTSVFDRLGGGIDDRSLRDWGYVLGSWEPAVDAGGVGLWFSPYRFWAEPREGAGSFSCLRRP